MTKSPLRLLALPLLLQLGACGDESETSGENRSQGEDNASSGDDSATGGAANSDPAKPGPSTLQDPWASTGSGVFVHLFEWPWPDIAEECEQVLGPAGYSAVQVSPPNEHWKKSENPPWWQRYQPVSYALESRSGSREEFINMVQRCAAVGVGIYVDAVLNHMSAQPNGTGSAGTKFKKYSYPELWSLEDFRTPPCAIEGADYANNATRVQECELLGLPDLNTGKDSVRQQLADYLIELTQLGVAGFRIDAAKHMAGDDIDAIVDLLAAEVDQVPFLFLEVIQGQNEAVTNEQYLPIQMGSGPHVALTDFQYAGFAHHFRLPASLGELGEFSPQAWELPPSDRTVVFTDNHDTQRGESISYREGKSHELANVFLLAMPHGYPKIMSSYSFTEGSGIADGPPSDESFGTVGPHHENSAPCLIELGASTHDAQLQTTVEDGRWICEHRNPALLAMLKFRRQTQGAEVSQLWHEGQSLLAFARKGLGFVAFNLGPEEVEHRLQTDLPEGEYCNILIPNADCSAPVEVDESGAATIKLPAISAVALLPESP